MNKLVFMQQLLIIGIQGLTVKGYDQEYYLVGTLLNSIIDGGPPSMILIVSNLLNIGGVAGLLEIMADSTFKLSFSFV